MAPSQIAIRNMKYFDRNAFRNDLKIKLGEMPTKSYGIFEKTFVDVLDTHPPEKKKSVRTNQKQYVTKSNENCNYEKVRTYNQT